MTNREVLKVILRRLGEVYRQEITASLAELYWRALCDLPDRVIERACVEAVKQSKYFPKPAEIRAIAYRAGAQPETDPKQLRLPDMPHNPRGRAMIAVLAELVGLPRAARVDKLRGLADENPGIGWEEALAEAERGVAV